MAKITFEAGDVFTFAQGAGVVLEGEKTAVMITGDGRSGYAVEKGSIPADAKLVELDELDSSKQMAIRGALAANGEDPTTAKVMRIYFEFEGVEYTLPMSASRGQKIILPDGRILMCNGWSQTMPPKPRELTIIGKVDGTVAQKA